VRTRRAYISSAIDIAREPTVCAAAVGRHRANALSTQRATRRTNREAIRVVRRWLTHTHACVNRFETRSAPKSRIRDARQVAVAVLTRRASCLSLASLCCLFLFTGRRGRNVFPFGRRLATGKRGDDRIRRASFSCAHRAHLAKGELRRRRRGRRREGTGRGGAGRRLAEQGRRR
jgi:hypothetical protein